VIFEFMLEGKIYPILSNLSRANTPLESSREG